MNTLLVEDGIVASGRFIACLRDAVTGEVKDTRYSDNLVCDRGKNIVAARLNNETTYTGIINYLGVGTGTTTPLSTDTQLQTELARTTVSSSSRSNSQTTLGFFFNSSTANGTITEVGAFIDGSASANSGQIWNHALFSPSITKTSAETLTITLVTTIS